MEFSGFRRGIEFKCLILFSLRPEERDDDLKAVFAMIKCFIFNKYTPFLLLYFCLKYAIKGTGVKIS